MKKYTIKKKCFASLAITIALIFSCYVPVSAMISTSDITQNSLNLKRYSYKDNATINSDINLLNSVGIMPNSVTLSDSKEGEFIYNAVFGEYTNTIRISRPTDGSIIFDIKEGDIENTLIIKPDGEMVLDGERVKIFPNNSTKNIINTPVAMSSSWSTTPPAGVTSWTYLRTVSDKSIFLNTPAGQLTTGAIGIILSQAGWLGYVYNVALFAHNVGAYSTCLSLKSLRYAGNPRYLLAYKVNQTLYTGKNFTGKSKTYVSYGYRVPNI